MFNSDNVVSYNERYINDCVNLFENVFSIKDSMDLHYWKFQHNPFGSGRGFLYIYNDECVSLRLFMCWNYIYNGKIINALQPVDSATRKDFRGLGLFSRMTKMGVESISGNCINFPNENSVNTYIKLGWSIKYKLKAKYILTFTSLYTKSKSKIEDLCDLSQFKTVDFNARCLSTNWCLKTLNWRFIQRPNSNYKIYKDNDKLVIFIIKKKYNISIAQILYSTDNVDNYFVNNFSNALVLKGVMFMSYFGVNSMFSDVVKSKIGMYLGKELNVAVRGDIAKYETKIELCDTDFI